MRRIGLLVTMVGLLMAALIMLSAVTAFAAAGTNSSCFGKYDSTTKEVPDTGPGSSISDIATTLGQIPGGDQHSSQVLNTIRVETGIC